LKLILDNIIFSLQKSGGVSAYWYELLVRILNNNKFDIDFLENSKSSYNIFRQKLNIDENNVQYSNDSLFSRIKPVKLLSKEKIVFHSSYYRYARGSHSKVITTVHDFIQEKVNNSNWGLNSIMKRVAITNSDLIIAISENTKNDLLNFYPRLNPKNIHVIYNGVSESYFPLLQKEFLPNMILFVGSRVNYKNFDIAVDVVSKFQNFNLVIAGNQLTHDEQILLNTKLSSSRWNFRLNPTNEELNILYNQASLLIYPSSYEGFGIPIIEAMKSGCPVIALNSSSIPEIAGEAALLVEKTTVDDYYDGIKYLMDRRDHYVKLGLVNASRFSWDSTFEETIKLYKI
jgi:mannosyltransferase